MTSLKMDYIVHSVDFEKKGLKKKQKMKEPVSFHEKLKCLK